MFFGTYEHALDDKGRLAVPRSWRDGLAQAGRPMDLWVTCSMPWDEPHLEAFTPAAWEQVKQGLREERRKDRNTRPAQRLYIARAIRLTIDRQGRLLLPAKLREFAGLDRDVVCSAVEDEEFEMWAPALWAKQEAADQAVAANPSYRSVLNR